MKRAELHTKRKTAQEGERWKDRAYNMQWDVHHRVFVTLSSAVLLQLWHTIVELVLSTATASFVGITCAGHQLKQLAANTSTPHRHITMHLMVTQLLSVVVQQVVQQPQWSKQQNCTHRVYCLHQLGKQPFFLPRPTILHHKAHKQLIKIEPIKHRIPVTQLGTSQLHQWNTRQGTITSCAPPY